MKTIRERWRNTYTVLTMLWAAEGIVVYFFLDSVVRRYCLEYLLLHVVMYLICLGMSLLYVRRPFEKTEKLMQDFGSGHGGAEVLTEAVPISVGFSKMLEKYGQLLDKEKLLELSVEQSRYLALQNQMNPHFLYNTLDAIRSDQLMAGMTELARTTEALSTFFRYTVSEMDKYATVAQELENVKDYFHIQQYRFGERLQLKVDMKEVEQDIHNLCITRMTLQPMVENAIYHGLECRAKAGTVTIKAIRTQRQLLLLVEDDGVGMPTEEVDRLNASLEIAGSFSTGKREKGGIALNNVNTRIKLLFGDSYGITVFSQEGIGTCVQIKFPVMTRDTAHEKRMVSN